jgi:broad specificity phosphatase PhoE
MRIIHKNRHLLQARERLEEWEYGSRDVRKLEDWMAGFETTRQL